MKRLVRLVIVAMALTLVGGLIPPVSQSAAQETATKPVGMVSGPWRMMAWQLALAPSFPEQGLESRSGSNWVILIADMTNTGVTGGLSVADVKLGASQTGGDPAESARLSKALGFEAIGEDGVVPVAENGIARVAIVFDYVGDPQDLSVAIGDQSVSVASVLGDSLAVTNLPEAPTGMQLEVGTLEDVEEAPILRMRTSNGELREIPLVGLTVPSTCYREESRQAIRAIAQGGVWIEIIPGVEFPTIWTNDATNGTFALLDQNLVDVGAVGISVPRSSQSIYGAWLTSREVIAEQNSLGVFDECGFITAEAKLQQNPSLGTETASEIEPSPTPTPSPTPRPTFTPTPVSSSASTSANQLPGSLEVFNNPNRYVQQPVAVSGYVLIVGNDGGDTYLLIYDKVRGQEVAFAVMHPGIKRGIVEGDYVTVYGLGAGAEEIDGEFLPLVIAVEIEE